MASGGSSGERGRFVFDRHALVEFICSLQRPLRRRLATMGGPPPGGLTLALVGAPSAVHATGVAPAITAGGDVRYATVPATLPLDELVRRLNALQPPALVGYPTMLARLAAEQQAGRLRIAPLSTVTTSENLLPEHREAISKGFGTPLVNTFGSTEGLVGVSEPDDEALVFNTDVCIVELVDAQNRPVPPGTLSAKVLLTNLSNRAQPLIRYELTDRFVAQPAAPDHGHLRATVEGRADEVLRFGDVDIHPFAIRQVLVKTPEVIEYQVRQTATGIDVAVVVGGRIDTADLEGTLRAALAHAGFAGANVAVEIVPHLARHGETGKLRRFIPA
jgi:phenylacetate-coenzyme A ligase PaaK-like adenylate-forming protein